MCVHSSCISAHIQSCLKNSSEDLQALFHFIDRRLRFKKKNQNLGHHPELAHGRTRSLLVSEGANSKYSPVAKGHSVRLQSDVISTFHKDKESPSPSECDLLEKKRGQRKNDI